MRQFCLQRSLQNLYSYQFLQFYVVSKYHSSKNIFETEDIAILSSYLGEHIASQ